MYFLREFRDRPNRLSDRLPWGALAGPGLIINKDGSFQKTFKYRGPDLDSATKYELAATVSKINNIFKRLPGGWVLYADAHRIKSERYPKSQFPDVITTMIDEERRLHFEKGNHFESHYYLTLIYLPPPDTEGKIREFLLKRKQKREKVTYQEHKKLFLIEAERVFRMLAEILPEMKELNSDETLTYLHSCISIKRHPIKTPKIPLYLDAMLVDTPFLGGIEPKLGNCHLRTICIKSFPDIAVPGMLDNLNRLNFEYRWTTRFIALDKVEAMSIINGYRRKWFNSRKSAFAVVKEIFTHEESRLENSDALKKSYDSDAAAQELAADAVSFGYYTMTITVMDESEKRVEAKVRAIEETINSLGFITITEDINTVEAWFGSLPGVCRANIRRPILNSLNLVDLFPLSALWAGPEENKCLNGPPLMFTQTAGNTPFRFDLFTNGDVGHTLVVGPTGMGKSLFLALMAAQFRRYTDAQIYYFDKGGSVRALTAGVGGDFYDLGQEEEGAISFQPLANINDQSELEWAHEWILELLELENIPGGITPAVRNTIWEALLSVKASPVELRTMTTLYSHVMSDELQQALFKYTSEGPFGRLFDGSHEGITYSRFQTYEMETLMGSKPSAVVPTLRYIFHRLEGYFKGKPSLLVLDEAWTYLKNPIFAAKIEQWLRELRKKKVAVVFATQSLAEIKNSSIAPVIIESCMTKIYLPNPTAREETILPIYRSFGLNEREIDIISQATGKRQYYFKGNKGTRLFEFALDQCPIALAYCGASSKEDQKKVEVLLQQYGKEGFNSPWLMYKRLPEAAEIYNRLTKQL